MKALVLSIVLGWLVGTVVTPTVKAQTTPSNTGNLLNYPSGTRIYQGGAIVTPTGTVVNPNVTVPGANGSNTLLLPGWQPHHHK